MKGRLCESNSPGLIILLASLVLLSGCARSPEGAGVVPVREVSFEITFNGPINDNYFYFTVMDINGGGDGPTPVFPGITPGEGWVTGSATHFVQYHQGQYTLHRIVSLQPFQAELIGAPLRPTPPGAGGTSLRFTVDLDALGASGDSIDINIIAVDQPFAQIRLLDALGEGATEILNVEITTDRTITSSDLPDIEPPAQPPYETDVLDQNRTPQPLNDLTRPLDIQSWRITVDI